jgi:hypothetical protein
MADVIEVNCETGEVTTRPQTAEEIAAAETLAAQWEADQAAKEAADKALADLKASAKAKLIAGSPLTPEEADTLVI